MDLREFISTALQEIVGGGSDAQAAVTGDGEVNPNLWMAQRGDAAKHKIMESDGGKWIHLVDFDVAVSVAEGTGTKGGLGLVVGPLALGTQGQSNAQNSTVTRLKFSIPIAYPRRAKS